MKVLLTGSFAPSLVHFRGHLLAAIVRAGHQAVACAPDCGQRWVADWLRERGIEFRTIPLQRTGLNPLYDVYTIIALARLFRAEHPDLVIFYTVKPILYGTLAAQLAGIRKTVCLVTGLGHLFSGGGTDRSPLRACARRLYRHALDQSRPVFFQNRDDLKLFLRLGILRDAGKAVVVPGSGVDLDFFQPVALPPGEPVFLLAARLVREKGIAEYAQAAAELKQRRRNAKFNLAGMFEKRPGAISPKELKGWTDRGTVVYQGWVKDIRPLIASSTVYVLPSYREGLPRTVMEAMAMGRPIITTNAPGCRETVVPHENGLLVPVGDVPALVEAMDRFILEPGLAAEMGRKSRLLAERKFSVHDVNLQMLQHLGLLRADAAA